MGRRGVSHPVILLSRGAPRLLQLTLALAVTAGLLVAPPAVTPVLPVSSPAEIAGGPAVEAPTVNPPPAAGDVASSPAVPPSPSPSSPAATPPSPSSVSPPEPGLGESVAEEPGPAESVAEEPGPAESVAEEPGPAESVAEEPGPAESVAEEPEAKTPPSFRPEMEGELARLANEERLRIGLPALSLDPDLTLAARLKAEDMLVDGYFGHTSPTYGSPFDMMRALGVSFSAAGENLAGASTVAIAHDALMASSGHRANILRAEFTRIGVGVVEGGPYGHILVQLFSRP